MKKLESNLYGKSVVFKKMESLFILLNSNEAKFVVYGMIFMKIETLTDVSFELE